MKSDLENVFFIGGQFASEKAPRERSFDGQIRAVRYSKTARYSDAFTPAERWTTDADTVALYRFEEGQGNVLKDSSSNRHHGKIVGADWVRRIRSEPAKQSSPPSTDFAIWAAKGAGVVIDSLKLPRSGPITIEGYVTPQFDKSPRSKHLFGGAKHAVSVNESGRWSMVWTTKTGTDSLDTAPFIERRRTHVAGVLDGRKMRLFVDGKLAAEGDLGEFEPGTEQPFSIGGSRDWAGAFDEIRVSKSARYTKEFVPQDRFEPDADTLALYHCDEGKGEVLVDSSGNGHDGTVKGMGWVLSGPAPSAETAAPSVPRSVPGLHFAGRDQYVEMFIPARNEKPWTAEGWIVVDKVTARSNLFASSEFWYSNVRHDPGHLPRWFFVSGAGSVFSKDAVSLHQRTHYALTHSDGELSLFVDGKLQGRFEAKQNTSKNYVALFPTAYTSTGIYDGFYGTLDNLRYSKVVRYTKDFTPPTKFVPDADTIGLYRCDEGTGDVAKDSSGNDYHGKIVGAKWVKEQRPTASEYALKFAGSDKVTLPTLPIAGLGQVCFEAWATTSQLDSKEHPSVFSSGWQGSLQVSPLAKWQFIASLNGDWHWAYSPKPAIVGRRTHIAGVLRPDGIRLYVDGVLVEKKDLAGFRLGAPKNETLIGAGWHGTIEQVRISKSFRYDKDFVPQNRFVADTDTIALYNFDEGSGDELKDSSGNNYHGKIVGAKWVKPDPLGSDYELKFDGAGSHVLLESLKLPAEVDELTLECFVTPAPTDTFTMSMVMIGGESCAAITKGGTDFGCDFYRAKDASRAQYEAILLGNSFVPDRRTHVAVVHKSNRTKFFVNGQEAKTLFGVRHRRTWLRKPSILGSVYDLEEGKKLDFHYDGAIDELRVSKVARYTKPFTPKTRFEPDADTLALYHFDEGQGEVAKDSSGNNHHGKIVGAKWVKVSPTPEPAAPIGGLRFAGKGQHVLPTIASRNAEPWTLEGWAVVEKVPPTGNVIASGQFWEGAIRERGNDGPRLYLSVNDAGFVRSTTIPLNRRFHYAFTHSDGVLKLFFNGELQGTFNAKLKNSEFPTALFPCEYTTTGIYDGVFAVLDHVRYSKIARYEKDFRPPTRLDADADTIAMYRCDEGAGTKLNDSSGNGHHAWIVGAGWVKASEIPRTPQLEAGLAFDGKKDRVEVPSFKFDGSHPITMEGWFAPRAKDHAMAILLGEIGKAKLQLKIGADAKTWAFILADDRIDQSWAKRAIVNVRDALMLDGRRDHVAGIWNGKTLRLFVNGKKVGEMPSDPANEKAIIPQGTLQLGFDRTENLNLDHGFLGTMHAVRISRGERYSGDFTPQEQLQADKDTLVLYRFNEGSGDIVKDLSGKGHDGKIVGAKWVKELAGPDRQAAEWVLLIGGTVKVDQVDVTLTAIDKLPKEPFKLTSVSLLGTKVGDAELAKLARLADLRELDLGGLQISNGGLVSLGTMKSLAGLNLERTQIDDAGLKELHRFPSLQGLGLAALSITDAGLKEVLALESLQSLNVAGSKVTRDGLLTLKKLPKLRQVYVGKTSLSPDDLGAINKAIPEWQIHHDRGIIRSSLEAVTPPAEKREDGK